LPSYDKRGDIESTRTNVIYIGVSIVVQTQLCSGLYNSFLTQIPGSERVRNSIEFYKDVLDSPSNHGEEVALRKLNQNIHQKSLQIL